MSMSLHAVARRRRRAVVVASLVGITGLVSASSAPAAAVNDPIISIGDAEASEADGVIEFDVTLNKPARRTVNALVVARDLEARFGDDFSERRFNVQIPAGEMAATVAVPLVDDLLDEPDERFRMQIRSARNARVGARQGIGTITDDALTINVLHINDHHSNLDADDGSADLGTWGGEFDYDLGGFSRVVQAYEELSAELDNVVKVHAGDAITGTLYYSLFGGVADAAMMNLVCFDMFALGNHEFDDSDAGLAAFLDALAEGDCDTEVIAANVVPQIGTPLAPVSPTDYITPYVI